MEVYKENEEYMSSTEGSDPGEDFDMDPDYCYLEEKLSELTIRSKSKSRCSTAKDQEENVKDFELVQTIIEGGEVEKLKLEQCKVYLRKNGLRLTGNKSTLIERIKEHLEISNGGEKKYPVSSFVLDCKGDACTGDVVMFEQNVYEMFNIASRSANGPPCGKRMVAGRIVKESYGAAKQQHTFTIEVLWSKGAKPLPPLHPLLIKGRNLYRLQTLRQRWEDEGKRCKVLMEKHARGSQARSSRETRIHEKEVRRQHKANRVLMEGPKRNQSQLNVQSQEKAETLIDDDHKQLAQHLVKNAGFREVQYRRDENFQANHRQPDLALRSHQPPISMYRMDPLSERTNYVQPLKSRGHHPQTSHCRQPLKSSDHYHHPKSPPQSPIHKYSCTNGQSFQNICSPTHQSQKQGWMKQKLCHFYPRGRCYYGDNCKFWHELSQGCDQTWPGIEPERTNCIQLLKSRDNHYPQTSPCRQPLKSSGHYHPPRSPPRSPIHKYSCTNDGQSFQNVCSPTRQSQKQGWMEQKLCQFYPRGRCYYGDNCKFLHEL